MISHGGCKQELSNHVKSCVCLLVSSWLLIYTIWFGFQNSPLPPQQVVLEPKRSSDQRFNKDERRRLKGAWSKSIFSSQGTKVNKILTKREMVGIDKYFMIPKASIPMRWGILVQEGVLVKKENHWLRFGSSINISCIFRF